MYLVGFALYVVVCRTLAWSLAIVLVRRARDTFTGSGSAGTTSRVIGGAALRLSPTQWQSPDGKFTYDQQGSDGLRVTINGDAGGSNSISTTNTLSWRLAA